MKTLNPYQILQLFLVGVVLLFFFILLFGIEVPEKNAQWVEKVWQVLLIILSPAALAAIIVKASGGTPPADNQPPPDAGFVRVWLLILITVAMLMAACATAPPSYNISCTNITGSGEGYITYKADSDQKPTTTNKTDIKPAIQGNVPIQGGTVSNPTNSAGK
jgi:hypothetical protein